MSVPVTLRDLEKRDARGHFFVADLHNYTRINHLTYITTETDMATQVGSILQWVSHAPVLKRLGSSFPIFLDPILTPKGISHAPSQGDGHLERAHFGTVIRACWVEVCFYEISHAPSQGVGAQAYHKRFGILYLCADELTQSDQMWCGNACRGHSRPHAKGT